MRLPIMRRPIMQLVVDDMERVLDFRAHTRLVHFQVFTHAFQLCAWQRVRWVRFIATCQCTVLP